MTSLLNDVEYVHVQKLEAVHEYWGDGVFRDVGLSTDIVKRLNGYYKQFGGIVQ